MNDPFQPHSHDNNPLPPDDNTTLQLTLFGGSPQEIPLNTLRENFPQAEIPAYQYTTDHGVHGPYRLIGVALGRLIELYLGEEERWTEAEVVSADGFGNRIYAEEADPSLPGDPILLCYASNGRELSRAHGLVRLVVPSETDNALRQIKWVREINVK
ncbi:MAG: molybdopterin-dependent oxidoreductase [Chloroflexota bacterium]